MSSVFPNFLRRNAHTRTLKRAFSTVTLSRDRLDQLLRSEITHFAMERPTPFSLCQILEKRELNDLALFVHEQLPVRFATRIKALEELPQYKDVPYLVHVRNIYLESFKQLRMVNCENKDDFNSMLHNLKRRHAKMVPLMVTGLRELRQKFPQTTIKAVDMFLNSFFLNRIGTEMITSQYLTLSSSSTKSGIIDEFCDPMRVVQTATEDAAKLCSFHYSICPQVKIWNFGVTPLPYIPQYLYYIVFELLKNSMRASIENFKKNNMEPASPSAVCMQSPPDYETNGTLGKGTHPIQCLLSGDEHEVGIKISDHGGGVRRLDLDNIWSYMYTTARPAPLNYTASPEITSLPSPPNTGSMDVGPDTQDGGQHTIENDGRISPLAGFGCGLPLSRLYAHFLGGTLQLVSMPLYGTDAFLFLSRIGDIQVALPHSWEPNEKQ